MLIYSTKNIGKASVWIGLIYMMNILVSISYLVTFGFALKFPDCPDLSPACKPGKCKPWSYHGVNGPSNWTNVGFKDCSLKEQSPINLVKNSDNITNYKPIKFGDGYTSPMNGTWVNSGETIQFEPSFHENLTLTGGIYEKDVYQLSQLHFHWGCKNIDGTEHILNGISYSLELHLVHWKRLYGSFANATRFRDGLAVIGILFKAKDSSEIYKDLFQNLQCARDPDRTTRGSIHIHNILRSVDRGEFFTYKGSLTIPPCSQIVIWTVLTTVIDIPSSEIEDLRGLKNCHCQTICNNLRPIQHVGDRVVSFNSSPKPLI